MVEAFPGVSAMAAASAGYPPLCHGAGFRLEIAEGPAEARPVRGLADRGRNALQAGWPALPQLPSVTSLMTVRRLRPGSGKSIAVVIAAATHA